MDFTLSEEQLMIQQAAKDFAQNELLPGVIERDETQTFPWELVQKMGELGFMGMMVNENMEEAVLAPSPTCWPWKNYPKLMPPPP